MQICAESVVKTASSVRPSTFAPNASQTQGETNSLMIVKLSALNQ